MPENYGSIQRDGMPFILEGDGHTISGLHAALIHSAPEGTRLRNVKLRYDTNVNNDIDIDDMSPSDVPTPRARYITEDDFAAAMSAAGTNQIEASGSATSITPLYIAKPSITVNGHKSLYGSIRRTYSATDSPMLSVGAGATLEIHNFTFQAYGTSGFIYANGTAGNPATILCNAASGECNIENSSTAAGTALIVLNSYCTLHFYRSPLMNNNSCPNSGLIEMRNGNNIVKLEDWQYFDNKTANGVVWARKGPNQVKLGVSCYFKNNTATNGGAVIHVDAEGSTAGTAITIDGGSYENNSATGTGKGANGGVVWIDDPYSTVTIKDTTDPVWQKYPEFIENKAANGQGGVIYMPRASLANLSVSGDVVFQDNSAGYSTSIMSTADAAIYAAKISANSRTCCASLYNNYDVAYPALNEYNVSFNSMGGSSVAGQTVMEGELATNPGAPANSDPNAVFQGWRVDANCGAAFDFSTAVTGAATAYACWSCNPSDMIYNPAIPKCWRSFNVTIHKRNGETPGTYTAATKIDGTIDTQATPTPPSSPAGATFAEWNYASGCGGQAWKDTDVFTGADDLYACWSFDGDILDDLCDPDYAYIYTDTYSGCVYIGNPPQGPKGDKGDPGTNGADGAPGANGVDGKDGKDGANGADGAPGKDGTNGVDGAKGEPGKDGVNGADGANGVDGKDGKDGKDGAPGKDGTNGVDGAKGEPGKDGVNGADGANGVDGKDGRDGAPGATGPQGIPGPPGPAGDCSGCGGMSEEEVERLFLKFMHKYNCPCNTPPSGKAMRGCGGSGKSSWR
jgi:hypothetical protein